MVKEVQNEIQQTQQNFLTAMANLIRQELGKFSPPSGLKTPKPTPSHPKSAASPEKIKVDIAALEKSTGLKSDWRRNSPWRKAWKTEYNRLYNQLAATVKKRQLSRAKREKKQMNEK